MPVTGVQTCALPICPFASPNSPALEGARSGETLSGALERHISAMFLDPNGKLPAVGLYHRMLRELEGPLLTASLTATRGNQIKAAELLGLNRNTLRKKNRDLDLLKLRGHR